MTKKMAFVKVCSVTFVAVGAVVITSIGMPRASGDPPIDTGGGSGGGGPPGGVADAPGGVSNDGGLWSATVGGTEFSGLGASDVGRLLWRGQKVSATILGDDGVPRTVQVCEDFPEITLEGASFSSMPGDSTASVDLRFGDCTVVVSKLTHTTTGVSTWRDAPAPTQRTLIWRDGFNVDSVPVAWRNRSSLTPDSVWFSPPRYQSWRSSILTMRLMALDGLGLRLTKTEISRRYLEDSLRTTRFRKDCDANSPGGRLGVHWREDGCTGGHSLTQGRARAWAQGRFHGEITDTFPGTNRRVRFNRSTHHTMNLLLVGTAQRDIRRCTINPPSIEGLEATPPIRIPLLPESYGVRVTCSHQIARGLR